MAQAPEMLQFHWLTQDFIQVLSVFNTDFQLFITEGGVAKKFRGVPIGHTVSVA